MCSFVDFAARVDIPRKTLEDQISRCERKQASLPDDTQRKLASKFGFALNWPEWVTGESKDFAARYHREKQEFVDMVRRTQVDTSATSSQRGAAEIAPRAPSKVIRYVATAACALIALSSGLVSYRLQASPAVSHVRLFDESKSIEISGSADERPRHTLTALVGRSDNDFGIKDPESFFMAIGFLLKDLKVQPDGSMDVTLTVEGLSKDGNGNAWTEVAPLTYKDRWKSFDIAKSVGASAVLREFAIKDGDAIPIAVVIECMDSQTLSRWSGDIQIKVADRNGDGQTYSLPHPFKAELTPRKLSDASSKSCPG
jgi:hypothetical protein